MDASTKNLNRRGLMLVISSPSGAGKSTLCSSILSKDHEINMSVSVTTRACREGEIHGKHYFFIKQSEFDQMVSEDALLEYATVFQNSYGTPKAYVEQQLLNGQDVLFDIDWQGAQQLRQRKGPDVVSVFILPPNASSLESRLKKRDQDSDDVVAYRMSKSTDEMSHWQEYDYVIINDDLDQAKRQLDTILAAERLKRERQTGLYGFVQRISDQARNYKA